MESVKLRVSKHSIFRFVERNKYHNITNMYEAEDHIKSRLKKIGEPLGYIDGLYPIGFKLVAVVFNNVVVTVKYYKKDIYV